MRRVKRAVGLTLSWLKGGRACCPQPEHEPEVWRCKHGLTWVDLPDYEMDEDA